MDGLFSVPLFTREEPGWVEEADWVAAARSGDPIALEHLYHSYSSLVYGLCYRLLGNEDDAQDAMQTTFVRAFGALPSFRCASSLKTWIYRIAVNEASGLLRKRRPAARLDDALAARDGYGSIADRADIVAVLARLRPDYRAVLVLRFWEDLSYEEIAAVLGVSVSAAKMRIQRARTEFRRWYELPE